jgi:glutamyl-tRNA synthetase
MGITFEKQLKQVLTLEQKDTLYRGMNGLKQRAKTLVELTENALFYFNPPTIDEEAQKLLEGDGFHLLDMMENQFALIPENNWTEAYLENRTREIAEEKDTKLGKIAQPLRAALTGKAISPSVFEIMGVLGKAETLNRFQGALKRN